MEGEELLSSQFPPGFRFHPTDQELITQYLWKKVTGSLPSDWAIIADIDLYKYNPWDLPDKALFGQGEWFFFSPRERKYPNGVRPNRAAASGYWKATGTDKPILSGGVQCIGVKKALVFYQGRPPKGTKTDWVMQEYRLLDSMAPTQTQKQKSSMRLDDWVLCRVRMKGNSVGETDETFMENSSGQVSQEKHEEVKEKNSSSNEWGEHLIYLLESPGEVKENSGEGSSQGFIWSSDHLGCGSYAEAQQQQLQQSQEQSQHSDRWF